MKKMTQLIAALGLAASFALAGCGGGAEGKCEKLIDKSMELAKEMAKSMGGEDKLAEMEKEFEKKKPEAVKMCAEALKKDKELEKAVDCIIDAKDMAAMMKCEGADKLKGMMR